MLLQGGLSNRWFFLVAIKAAANFTWPTSAEMGARTSTGSFERKKVRRNEGDDWEATILW